MHLALKLDKFNRPTTSSVLTLVSTSADGRQGNDTSYAAQVTSDGRYVVFASDAANLVEGDKNGQTDIFRKDLVNGAVVRVSTASTGAEANSISQNPQISPDGRYAVFMSCADNLVGGDKNGQWDVFRKDLHTGAVVRASTGADGGEANGASLTPLISADGRFVVFTSDGSNLVANDQNGANDIFRKDLVTGAIVRISTNAKGTDPNGGSFAAQTSAGGRYVVFSSDASNLIEGDKNGQADIFRKDIVTGDIARISTGSTGREADGSSAEAKTSADGRYVVFTSDATNLVADDKNGQSDIFRKDLLTGEVVRVSTNHAGAEGDGICFGAQISGDGRYVVFTSTASNLVANDTNGKEDVFRKDLLTGQIIRVSANNTGAGADGESCAYQISPDGRHVLIASNASNLAADDKNGTNDLILVDAAMMANLDAVRQGSFVEFAFDADIASKVSIAWGDGFIDAVTPVNGVATFHHGYANPGIKTVVAKTEHGEISRSVSYIIDIAKGQMTRNGTKPDTISGSAGHDPLDGDGFANIIRGHEGNDIVSGGGGNDQLLGGTGHDKLYGGAGKDTLTGGANKDVFVFNSTVARKKNANIDTIKDFNAKDDAFWLENAVFKALGRRGSEKKPLKLSKDAFFKGNAAHDESDRIIVSKTGKVYYDADGTGAQAKIHIATVNKGAVKAMSHADFFVI